MSLPTSRLLAGLTVLVVDDDPDSLQVIGFALEMAGARVFCVSDTAEALETVQGGAVHVLLSDLYMPREDGWDLIRKVRALAHDRGGRIPAAVLTAHPSQENRLKSLAAGFDLVLGKPIDPDSLVRVVLGLKAGSV